MSTFDKKRSEWDQQALSSADLKKQVCRPTTEQAWQALLIDIKSKLQISTKLNSILDVGCGNGLLLSKLADDFDQLYGVDYASSMVEQAKILMPKQCFSVAEAAKLNFDDSSFDRVLSYSIFHYFPEQDYIIKAINEMIRVTKPGGIILIGDLLDKDFEQKIKGASDPLIEEKLPDIMRYSQWTFCDLAAVKLHFSHQVKHIEILNQPEHFQLSEYRKDLRICL
ncbi:class I SAM-dependent methyltransferase [Colwellia sp. D2M02]|uniref:class I SAM-dependent methyltransferase n=1 Tax=Colwellia sp. D2M02 TaxID=2841562 RepID=UPI001C092AF3|nr:class I SAM-dependent methyltransferase [Colwellia sp. D2M02]MBU2892943.1 class I SAM-dependent methyltransferase [Colwellia sp. D2M02]